MTWQVAVRRLAELEMNRAVIWDEERRQGLGREFLDDFKAAVARIAERAASFPVEYRDLRKASLDRFPYKIWSSRKHSG